jgi:nicotinamidase-related amidase
MKVPHHKNRKKALVVVDVQPGFLNERNEYVVTRIKKLLQNVEYDLYFDAVFYTEPGSVWEQQQNWSMPEDHNTHTHHDLQDELKKRNSIRLQKQTKSAFKAKQPLRDILTQNDIQEVHVVGVDTHDCVLATAYDAFDYGFVTYVIEECCEAAPTGAHVRALEILRERNMTNNSVAEDIGFIEIE